MYRFQPAEPATVGIGQSRVNLPLRATPAPRPVSVRSKYQLRYGGCQQSEPRFAFGECNLLGMLGRSVAHDLDVAWGGAERHHDARTPKPGAVLALMPPLVFASALP